MALRNPLGLGKVPVLRAFVHVDGGNGLLAKLATSRAVAAIDAATKALLQGAILIEGEAKRNCPVGDTGRLRSSITHTLPYMSSGRIVVDVGTNVDYACVFGARTPVWTSEGPKCIKDVKVGDLVLTQAGDYQPVLATPRYVVRNPELVEVKYRWRARDRLKSGLRRIVVTPDHPLLSFVDGHWTWVEAKDLRPGSVLAAMRKMAHNKGKYGWPPHECSWCGKVHRGQGKKYCSLRCRDAAWAAGANPHLGRRRSEATRRKQSERAKINATKYNVVRHFLKWSDTGPEREVEAWLRERGVPFRRQAHISGRVVDFFVPHEGLVIEADGAYWHQDQASDVERDRDLLRDPRCKKVLHIHFHDRRFSPRRLVERPMNGVRYVSTNPGPSTFVDVDRFKRSRVVSVRRFTYRHRKNVPAVLYDLTVQGCHSFVLGGVVSSNTFVEFGTGRRGRLSESVGHLTESAREYMKQIGYVHGAGTKRPNSPGMAARPFLFPAYEKYRTKVLEMVMGAALAVLTEERG